MTFATSLILIAVGAILSFAIRDVISGVDLYVIGLILMAAGAIGFLVALLQEATWSQRFRRTGAPDERYDPRYR